MVFIQNPFITPHQILTHKVTLNYSFQIGINYQINCKILFDIILFDQITQLFSSKYFYS